MLFPVPLPTGSVSPPVYPVELGRPDCRPGGSFLEVSGADVLALPAQALPAFSSLGGTRSAVERPSLSWLS